MAQVLLFCVDEDAKEFVHRPLNHQYDGFAEAIYCIVESRDPPEREEPFRITLNANESFETDFIGASDEDCQIWALEQQEETTMIEENIIAIADKRSAQDDTVSLQIFSGPSLEIEPHGTLPPESNTWYKYRVNYKDVTTVWSALQFVAPEVSWPVYYGRKDELTDEQGVFDVARAQLLSRDEE